MVVKKSSYNYFLTEVVKKYTVSQKNGARILYLITLANVDKF